MSPSTNNEYRTPETMEDNAASPRRSVSPLLLVLLAFAVTTAALVWMSQNRQAEPLRPASALPAPTAPAEEALRERSTAAAPAPKAKATTRAAINREPRPLAGNAEPKYPAAALRAGVGGTVVVHAEVDANGVPVEVRVAKRSGERELDRAALSAVRQWRFEPAMRNGKTVASAVRVPVDFRPSDMVAAR
ncbi:energy transducer TonB [Pseudoxanthomonas putridarboris]|uniref:Energy transducer TonB n=1 Tax=Pseudoxanthomonas putridarboris TaxID=752605 RepID=A0ABU9IZ87_9GAMM